MSETSQTAVSPAVEAVRTRITEFGRMLFERQLTDAAGGNISARVRDDRVGDVICITPRYSGQKFQWRLQPEQVLVFDLQGNRLARRGRHQPRGQGAYAHVSRLS